MGLLGVVSLLPLCGMVWHGVGSGFLAVVPPLRFLGLLWVFGILIPTMIMMIMMMMGTMITIIIINSNTLIDVSLVGRPVSSARAPGNDYRFIDRRAIIFVTVVDLGGNCHKVAMGELSQGSGPSGNAVLVTVALFKTLMSESSLQGSGVFRTRSSSQLTAWVASCESCQN